MGRPSKSAGSQFTTREMAIAAELTTRNMGLLHDMRLAPASMEGGGGKGGHRLYGSPALAHAALIGALHLAGFELLVAARLAEAFAEEMGLVYGKLHSNIATYLQAPHNPRPGYRPWTETGAEGDLGDDYWVHGQLIDSPVNYRRGEALLGDMIIDIADQEFVLTETHRASSVKVFSPVLKGGMPASPDYRIVGRGTSARVVPITDEVDSLDFSEDPVSAERYRTLQQDYLFARENAVTRVRVNVSLAIRNAFDRVRADRQRLDARGLRGRPSFHQSG